MINFHEVADIISDVKKAKGLRKKLFFIFGSPIKIAHEKQLAHKEEVAVSDKI